MGNKCVLCGDFYRGYGNYAWPLAEGPCCDDCNRLKVIPARVSEYWKCNK